MILVQLFVHGGYLALAEGIVERVVDELGGNAEAGGGGAVVLNEALQAAILLVAIEVRDGANVPQLLEHFRRELDEVVQIIAAHRELILRGAHTSADAEVLRGLQIERRAGHSQQLGTETRNHEDRRLTSSGSSASGLRTCGPYWYYDPPVKACTVSTAGS